MVKKQSRLTKLKKEYEIVCEKLGELNFQAYELEKEMLWEQNQDKLIDQRFGVKKNGR